MKTKLLFLLPMLAVLFAACEKKSDSTSEEKSALVETISATDITSSSALLTGQVGIKIADYKSVEYGMLISEKESDVSSYGGQTLKGDKLIGQTFSITATGLSAETQYYYRAYLILNNMQYEYGAVKSFKTEKGGTGDGHQYVDLGLSVKWATCNVGATTPEEYGDYFAWGETKPKTKYDWSTYKYCNGSSSKLTKYCTMEYYGTVDNKTVLDLADDAARVNWKGNWRMPTSNEWNELNAKCTWTWATQNGVKGYQIKGRNGNSIFLPAGGYRDDTSLSGVGVLGSYWSSTLDEIYGSDCAYDFGFSSANVILGYYYYRNCGRSVRPVCQ
ncbi:MAG: fibrobacter succinogenes major paralogous domain-containing protein [Paludibacteraceae bacterium]|nr:fibrobacter succinogenes major paralogous domain-containing protein [Paludibacteraceae bacterium]